MEIEQAIRTYNRGVITQWAGRTLRKDGSSIHARISVSNAYRRIGLPFEALRCLLPLRKCSFDQPEHVRFWAEYILVLSALGATQYCRALVRKLPQAALSPAEMGLLFFACDQDNESFQHLKELPHLNPNDLRPTDLSGWMTLGFVLFRLGRFDESVDVLKRLTRIKSVDPATQVKSMACAAVGSLMLGRRGGAKELLERAALMARAQKVRSAAGELALARGAYECLSNHFGIARAHLRDAWQALYRTDRRPEIWGSVLYWRGMTNYLEFNSFPEEWARLLAFPGYRHRPAWLGQYKDVPKELVIDAARLRKKRAETHIDLVTQTKIENKNGASRFEAGLDHPSLLLGALICAGKYGVPEFRLYEILWPQDPFSFQSQRGRLEQIVLRLRRGGYRIRWAKNYLYLTSVKNVSCRAITPFDRVTPRGGAFLMKNVDQSFGISEVRSFFSLSHASAKRLIREWKTAGAISRVRKGQWMARIR